MASEWRTIAIIKVYNDAMVYKSILVNIDGESLEQLAQTVSPPAKLRGFEITRWVPSSNHQGGTDLRRPQSKSVQ